MGFYGGSYQEISQDGPSRFRTVSRIMRAGPGRWRKKREDKGVSCGKPKSDKEGLRKVDGKSQCRWLPQREREKKDK